MAAGSLKSIICRYGCRDHDFEGSSFINFRLYFNAALTGLVQAIYYQHDQSATLIIFGTAPAANPVSASNSSSGTV